MELISAGKSYLLELHPGVLGSPRRASTPSQIPSPSPAEPRGRRRNRGAKRRRQGQLPIDERPILDSRPLGLCHFPSPVSCPSPCAAPVSSLGPCTAPAP